MLLIFVQFFKSFFLRQTRSGTSIIKSTKITRAWWHPVHLIIFIVTLTLCIYIVTFFLYWCCFFVPFQTKYSKERERKTNKYILILFALAFSLTNTHTRTSILLTVLLATNCCYWLTNNYCCYCDCCCFLFGQYQPTWNISRIIQRSYDTSKILWRYSNSLLYGRF